MFWILLSSAAFLVAIALVFALMSTAKQADNAMERLSELRDRKRLDD